MGVRYCRNYSIEEQEKNLQVDQFKIHEQHQNQQIYEPFNSIIMINQQSQKIVRCELSGLSYQIIELIKKFRVIADDLNPFLTIIHNFDVQEKLFLTKLIMYVDDIRDVFHERLKSQQEKKNAWLLIDCISEAMFKLQQKQKFLFGISSKLIHQVQTPFGVNVYKLHLWNLNDAMSIYQQWMEDYKKFHIIDHEQLLDLLPSPEILQQLRDGIQEPIYNGYKMDVFSFGLLLLQCLLGESVMIRIYNNWNLTYDGAYVQDLIQLVPIEYQNLITRLTEQNCDERMDWIQLKIYLNQELKISRLFDRHTLEEFYYFPKPQPISDNLQSQQTLRTVEQNIQDILISEHLTYRGEQKNGIKNGYGEILNQNNKVIMRGEFQNDKLNGRGILYNQENFMPSLFDQGHLNVHMDGQGWQKFEGYFQDNIRVGKGRIIFKNGDIFECSFIDSKANGYGVYVYNNGQRINGYWFMDQYQS